MDKILYNVYFIYHKKNDYWERSYEANSSFELVNKNPFSILETVNRITEDFIKEHNLNAILIMHLYEEDEIKSNKLNKRAISNYRYLKNIRGYKLNYFSDIDAKYGQCIICLISKIGHLTAYHLLKENPDYKEIFI